MSTATTDPTPSAPPVSAPGQGTSGVAAPASQGVPHDLYRMTVSEYERIGGMLDDDRIELIDGYLVNRMAKNPPHISTVKKLYQLLDRILPQGWTWQKEDPVRIPEFDEPEPDVSVLRGSDADYETRIPEPRDVALVVEKSESTLDCDQGPKRAAYARAGISFYWIINLVDRQIEVYSNPGPSGYQSHAIYKPGQDVSVVIDGVEVGRIAVAAILP